ncbi:DUF445 family protein [Deferribacter autotrophicus]|uniref:DUF445 family protein n=1 Tax=Deferribacter autotrophicus TaxID=500465 RepID=A0A5A8F514_9BACT|nr:DUF445 family protein [Deferribacter autotrophicus]KAA0256908.1 DUF445 family protein [Deferribacter autotrophicus]
MQQQLISLFTTPLLTGFVGYFTNYLAIKMLFRPYKKRWYSFGWQGVIPKNRKKLASEIGKLVGEELITEEELQKAIESERFQYVLEHTVNNEIKNFLKKDFGTLADIIDRFGLDTEKLLKRIFHSEKTKETINKLLNNLINGLIENLSNKKIKDIDTLKPLLLNTINNLFENKKIKDYLANEFISLINNFILSGKSISDLLTTKQKDTIIEKGKEFSEKFLNFIDNLLKDEKIKKNIAKRIIEIKNQYFGEGFFDQLKLGVLNIFLNEDTINELVSNELPKIIYSIKNDKEIKEKIDNIIEEKIEQFLSTPIYKHAEKIGIENLYATYTKFIDWFKESFFSHTLKNKVHDKVEVFFEQNSEYTLKGVLDSFGFKIENLSHIFNRTDHSVENIIHYIIKGFQETLQGIKIDNLYDKIPETTFENVKTTIINSINSILKSNIDKIVYSLNIDKLVEEKINSLDLYKLENLIFSFMKDQFKWINILGFVLGFIFGFIQSIVLLLIS